MSYEITLMDTITDLVRDTIDVGENVFAMTSILDKIELEAIMLTKIFGHKS